MAISRASKTPTYSLEIVDQTAEYSRRFQRELASAVRALARYWQQATTHMETVPTYQWRQALCLSSILPIRVGDLPKMRIQVGVHRQLQRTTLLITYPMRTRTNLPTVQGTYKTLNI